MEMVSKEFLEKHSDVINIKFSKYLRSFFYLFLIISYSIFAFYSLGFNKLTDQFKPDFAAKLIQDSYSYKDHVNTKWSDTSDVTISYEGGAFTKYDPKDFPEWFLSDTNKQSVIFNNQGIIDIFKDKIEMKGFGNEEEKNLLLTFKLLNGKPTVEGYTFDDPKLPKWIRVTENKVEVRPSLFERLQVYSEKIEIHRFQFGWKYFFFDFASPFNKYSSAELFSLFFSSNRLNPEISNARFMFNEFLSNEQWFHGLVFSSLRDTIFMAVIGTLFATIFGLLLAFLAAINITPFNFVRFFIRRFFDSLRGIDFLIWSLIFLRAFGPGLYTGILAIAFTDTGTLGKIMSEAIENIEKNQNEGVESTGATRNQQHRFGIIPQILPVFVSQSLYYFESNTRSAVILGAMGAGGIGLLFLDSIMTGANFENVAYMSILILIVVFLMDTFSQWLRRKLIGNVFVAIVK